MKYLLPSILCQSNEYKSENSTKKVNILFTLSVYRVRNAKIYKINISIVKNCKFVAHLNGYRHQH